MFLGKVLGKKWWNKVVVLREVMALQSYNILNDYVMLFYTEVFNPEVVPKMAFSIENDSGSTKFYVFTIVDYKLFQINKFWKIRLFSFHNEVLLWQLGNLWWWSCRNRLFYNIFHWKHSRPLNHSTTLCWNISEPFDWSSINRIGDWIEFLT